MTARTWKPEITAILAMREIDAAINAIRRAHDLLRGEGNTENVQRLFVAHEGVMKVKEQILAGKP